MRLLSLFGKLESGWGMEQEGSGTSKLILCFVSPKSMALSNRIIEIKNSPLKVRKFSQKLICLLKKLLISGTGCFELFFFLKEF